MSFVLGEMVDKKKVFLVKRSELEGRRDPFCYIPDLVELDNKIKALTTTKLRHFAKTYASGATPSKDNKEFYSDKENGIPFIRVQNLSTTGVLDVSNLIYISKFVHTKMLKRSQVKAGDLLVKITGVGRMAIASVAPEGFEGNINQHVVVIRTGSKEISENIAAFINLDVIEKLATKRATGATRPALDYPALFSIPIIESRQIFKNINDAVIAKKQKEAEAKELLASIDGYLLNELGITLPEVAANKLSERMFFRKATEVTGGRLDGFYYGVKFENTIKEVEKSKYKCIKLKKTVAGKLIKGKLPKDNEKNGECKVIQINSINADSTISIDKLLTSQNIFTKSQKLVKNDVLIVITGATIGKVALFDLDGDYYLGGDIVKLQTNEACNPHFVFNYLLSKPAQIHIYRNITGATNGHLSPTDIDNIDIPLPPLEKQNEIAEHITAIRKQAAELQQAAGELLENAKREVEKMILGEV